MTLERTYRRLLALYPLEHRQQYEDEMLGVLLDDAGPERRRPPARDVTALLHGALRARVRSAATNLSDQRWRDAAAVLGVLAPLVMLAYATRLVLLNLTFAAQYGYRGELATLSWQQWAAVGAWLTVVLLAVTKWRRAAALTAWPAVALELVRAVGDYNDGLLVSNWWPVALAMTAAVALTVVTPRSGPNVLGRRWLALLAGTALLASAPALTSLFPSTGGGDVRTSWIFTTGVGALEALLLGVGYLLGALAVMSTPAPLRRRLLAMLVPVGATLLITRIGFHHWIVLSRPFDGEPAVALNLAQWLVLALTPPLAMVVAIAIVHRRDRTLHLRTLGRAADRPVSSGPAG